MYLEGADNELFNDVAAGFFACKCHLSVLKAVTAPVQEYRNSSTKAYISLTCMYCFFIAAGESSCVILAALLEYAEMLHADCRCHAACTLVT